MWNIIKSLIGSSKSDDSSSHASTTINPATGLPVVNGIGSVDVQGNPYGVDLSCTGLSDLSFDHSHSTDFQDTANNNLSNDPFENSLTGHSDSFSSLGQDAFSTSTHDTSFSSHSSINGDTFNSTSSFSDDSWSSSSSSFSDDSWSSSSSFDSGSSWD